MRVAMTVLAALLAAALSGCATATPRPASTTPSDGTGSTFLDEARTYCTASGGQVQARQPTYGTNGDRSQWIELGEPVEVCWFQADDEAQSEIIVDLATLASAKPTLAALAYLSRTPMPDGQPSANPATRLCAALGGTSAYGTGVAGGGLVWDDGSAEPSVLTPCTFADGSMIDDWGIANYSEGTVRGADLSTLFRFDRTGLPATFGPGR